MLRYRRKLLMKKRVDEKKSEMRWRLKNDGSTGHRAEKGCDLYRESSCALNFTMAYRRAPCTTELKADFESVKGFPKTSVCIIISHTAKYRIRLKSMLKHLGIGSFCSYYKHRLLRWAAHDARITVNWITRKLSRLPPSVGTGRVCQGGCAPLANVVKGLLLLIVFLKARSRVICGPPIGRGLTSH